MRMRSRATRGFFGVALLCAASSWVLAQSADPQTLMQRVIMAGRTASYSGTFSFQVRGTSGTSRVTRLIDGTGDHERVEFLGGAGREIVRTNDELTRYLPDSKTIIVDRASTGRYPLRLAMSAKSLADVYSIRLGEAGTVAGHAAQQLVLEPRDDQRFGHLLWIDTDSGLLLRAQMLDEQGAVLEEFAFDDVVVGSGIDRARLKPAFTPTPEWQTVSLRGMDVRADEADWAFRALPPGFRLVSLTRRPLRPHEQDALHAVFSDGLVSVSVFLENYDRKMSVPSTTTWSGSTGIVKRMVGDFKITTLGEVPANALRRIANGVARRSAH
jgi:sigma-E factor negative regulatory protein RseB